MPLVVRRPDGSFALIMPDGSRQPLSDAQMHNVELPMSAVQQTQGVSGSRRRVFMNLTNNPEEAREYLEQEGYETRRLPEEAGAWNFAVRRKGRSDQPWQVVDPDGMDAGDFFDLLADVGLGILSTAGATVGSLLGPVGTALGAGAAGAGGEYVRQALGQAAGVPQDIDLGRIALEGGLSAASVPAAALAGMGIRGAGRVAGKLVRGGDKLTNAITARMANVRNAARSSSEEINTARANIKGYGRIAGAGDNGPNFYKILDTLTQDNKMDVPGRYTFPAWRDVIVAVNSAEGQGYTINLKKPLEPLFERLRTGIRPATERIQKTYKRSQGKIRLQSKTVSQVMKEEGDLPEIRKVLDRIQGLIGENTISTVPPRTALKISELMLDIIDNPHNPNEIASTLSAVGSEIIEELGLIVSEFDPLFADKLGKAFRLRRKLMLIRKHTAPYADPAIRHERSTRFLQDLGSDPKMAYLGYLHELEQEFGLENDMLTDFARTTTISKAFGFRGQPQTLGPMTTTGQFRGAALGAGIGGALGLTTGSLPGAGIGMGAGMLLGLTAGTPSVMLATRRASLKVGSILHPATQKLATIGSARRLALPSGALRVGARPVAQSAIVEQKPHRKQVQIGQF